MNKQQSTILRLAVQKEGRLTDRTLDFLCRSGLDFERYRSRLFSRCNNFPLEILFVRDDDIPGYVTSGTVDLGIVGQNILSEFRPNVKKLLNLRYGFCSFVVAVPKESSIQSVEELSGMTVATTYPNSTKKYFDAKNIPINTVQIAGSVEIAPALGIAQAVADLVSTGSTMALNDLKPLTTIYTSEAILIANNNQSLENNPIFTDLLIRFTSVLSAKNYKCIKMEVPSSSVRKITKLTAGLISSIPTSSTKPGRTILEIVMKEDVFWQIIKRLKDLGATKCIVSPVEKIIL